jgi:hypothetical protein
MNKPRLTIIDPREEARILAAHLGRETAREEEDGTIVMPLREPVAPIMECAAELRTAEIEYVMSEVPS